MRRFLFHTLARFDMPLILLALGQRLAPPAMRSASAPPIVETPEQILSESEISPELTLIFVDGSLRGAGVGVALLRGVETFLRARGGMDTLFARTNARSDNRAIAFYDRNGFERIGRSGGAGKTLVVMRKSITDATGANT